MSMTTFTWDFKPIPIDLVQINPIFIYYIFKIKCLRDLWFDFNSVKSSEIVFSVDVNYKKRDVNHIIIMGVMNINI